MASSFYVIGTFGGNMVFGTGDPDVLSAETTDEYTREIPAVDGDGKVVAIAFTAPTRTIRTEKYGTLATEAIGADGNIRITLRRSNEDFAKISVESKELIGD